MAALAYRSRRWVSVASIVATGVIESACTVSIDASEALEAQGLEDAGEVVRGSSPRRYVGDADVAADAPVRAASSYAATAPRDAGADSDASPSDTPPSEPPPEPPPPEPPEPPPPPPPEPDPGPPPGTCEIHADANGFIVRDSGKGSYVAFVPASYDGTPMRTIVGLHGCGDDAMNFARWGVNPYATRSTQTHIGISVGSESGSSKCWRLGNDDEKVLAAVDDLAKCFYVDRSRVTIAGFSSGGQLAYRVGLLHADRFAGILIENSALYGAGIAASSLLAGAAWRLPVAHVAHVSDTVFPLARVKSDWALTTEAGFPLTTFEIAGDHDGTTSDWADRLVPASSSWVNVPP